MNDNELLRYNRQIMLPQIDIAGQEKLNDAHVLVIGLGGLGSPAALYLASSGIGFLTLVDFDVVELSNLQRQLLYQNTDIGKTKVDAAKNTLLKLNPEIAIVTINKKLDEDALNKQIISADVVIDATDNFESRYAINRCCVSSNTPLVTGAAIRFEGQVSVFTNSGDNSPCYSCLFPNTDDPQEETCSENGILPPIVGIIGSIQALECIKLICGIGKPLSGKLLLFDGLNSEWRTINFKKDTRCPVCN